MADGTGGMREVRRYRVEGRVQGVGFRWWTRKTAADVGLNGRVRNLVDGAVEVEAAGPAGALDALAARLRLGPGPANVSRVERLDVGSALRDEAAGWSSFEIDRG